MPSDAALLVTPMGKRQPDSTIRAIDKYMKWRRPFRKMEISTKRHHHREEIHSSPAIFNLMGWHGKKVLRMQSRASH